MGQTDVAVILQGVSGLPRDRFMNTLHFDGDDWGNSLVDELWSKYVAMAGFFGGMHSGNLHEIRCYHPGPNPGGPYFSKKLTFTGAGTSSGPTEVALCLSYAAVDDPEASTKRRRGRIYLGPFTTSMVSMARPNATIIDAVLDLGEGIAQVGSASNVTWVLRSELDNSYHKIESVWCDDTWDTQRRRGQAPTAKTVRDVQ